MPSGPYTTVLFDFGGVITTSPFEAFRRYEAKRGLPPNIIRRINAVDRDTNAWARFERAEIDAAAFDAAFAAEAKAHGHDIAGADVIALLSGDIRPRMVGAIDRLKANGYTLGCITNNVPSGQGAGMTTDPEKAAAVQAILTQFDAVIESSKVGIRKPDPRIYAMMCERLGVAARSCVYLDDLGINCKPAAAMGMAAIKVEDEAQALGELEVVLGLRAGVLAGER